MSRTSRSLHPIVPQAEALGIYAVLMGGLVSVVAIGFYQGIAVVGASAGVVTLACTVWARRRLRRASPGARLTKQAVIAAVPVVLAAGSLLGYVIVLASVHTDYFNAKALTYNQRLSVATDAEERVGRTVLRLEREQKIDLSTVLTITERFLHDFGRSGEARGLAAYRARLHALFPHPAALGRAAKTAMAQLTATVDRAIALIRRPPPRTSLPAWFSRLQSTFELAAQILAALILALVFSRQRPADAGVNDVFRVSLLLALLGLLAALVGSLPSLHGTLQAILLGYVVAGLLSSGAAVALIAGRWVR